MGDWKKQLFDLGAKLPDPGEKVKKEPDPLEVFNQEREESRISYQEKKDVEMKEKGEDENNPDFRSLVKSCNLKPRSNIYYRVRDLFYNARRQDIEYDVNRWLGYEAGQNAKVAEICERLKEQGFESAAYVWWLAAQPEGMKTGTGSKELRLEKAAEYAKKVGKDLDDILTSRSDA